MSVKRYIHYGIAIVIFILGLVGWASTFDYCETTVYDARFGKGFDPFNIQTYKAISNAYIRYISSDTIFITDNYGDMYGLELNILEDIKNRFDPSKKYTIRYSVVFNYTGSLKSAQIDSIDGLSPQGKLETTNSISDDMINLESLDYEFEVLGDKVAIKKYKGNDINVIIPETINGKQVIWILEGAFFDNQKIESVFIPNYISGIKANAFDNCSNLKWVFLKDINQRQGIIDKDAFSNTGMIIIRDYEKSSTISRRPGTLNGNTIEHSYYVTNIKPENGYYTTKYTNTYEYFTYLEKEYGPCGYGDLEISLRDGQIFYIGLGFENSVFIGYNDKTYLAVSGGFGRTDTTWYKTENEYFIYIRRIFDLNNKPYAQLYKNEVPVSSIYDKIEIIDYKSPDDIRYIGENNKVYFACKNNIVIAQRNDEFYKIQFLPNNSIYYTNKYFADAILKNDGEIVAENYGISSFIVCNDESNIAYTTISERGVASLYQNRQLIYASDGLILHPTFSPDGKKLYYFDRIDRGQMALFYIKGPGIPSIISGPYLRPNGYGTFYFSKDSKYVACIVESFTKGFEGMYLILNSDIYGPYYDIQVGSFTDDSKSYVFKYEQKDGNWINERISLK
jgi:hypothetical protein